MQIESNKWSRIEDTSALKEKISSNAWKTLHFLWQSKIDGEAPPTIRKINKTLRIGSLQTTFDILSELEKHDLIRRETYKAKAISLNPDSIYLLDIFYRLEEIDGINHMIFFLPPLVQDKSPF